MLDLLKRNESIEELNQAMAYVKGNPIFHPSQLLKNKLISWGTEEKDLRYQTNDLLIDSTTTWESLPEEYKERPHVKEMLALKELILPFGGDAISTGFYEDDADQILSRGQLWYGDQTTLMKGRPSRCHQNSCDLWEVNRERTRICTGYALSEDGIWYQHSWLIQQKPKQNRVIETTVERVLYFGFVMTYDECEQFVCDNW